MGFLCTICSIAIEIAIILHACMHKIYASSNALPNKQMIVIMDRWNKMLLLLQHMPLVISSHFFQMEILFWERTDRN